MSMAVFDKKESEYRIGSSVFQKREKVLARWTRTRYLYEEPDCWFYPAYIVGVEKKVEWADDGNREVRADPVAPNDIIPADVVLQEGSIVNVLDKDDPCYYVEVLILEKKSGYYLVEAKPERRKFSVRFKHFSLDVGQAAAFLTASLTWQQVEYLPSLKKKPVPQRVQSKKPTDAPDKEKRIEMLTPLMVTEPATHAWLVSVPKDLAAKWQEPRKSDFVGTVVINEDSDRESLTAVYKPSIAQDNSRPEYTFKVRAVKDFKLISLSKMLNTDSLVTNSSTLRRMDMRPAGLFKRPPKEAPKVKQVDIPLIRTPVFLGPGFVSSASRVLNQKSQRRYREDHQTLKDQLLDAFEKFQYYRTSDLVKLTDQPKNYVIEILSEIGRYHGDRFVWELKPEYCHYE